MTEQASAASFATIVINLKGCGGGGAGLLAASERGIDGWRTSRCPHGDALHHRRAVKFERRIKKKEKENQRHNKTVAAPLKKIPPVFHCGSFSRYESINNRDAAIRRFKLKRQTVAPSAAAKTMNSKCIWWRRWRQR